MRKLIAILTAFTLLFSAAALAEDLSALTLEEYSQRAWPLTAEGYSDLLNNLDARYGQVYMVEGIVQHVLSQVPLRVIISAGEGGQLQPVVVECPADRSFNWVKGTSCNIYADVSSVYDGMPVLTARYMLFTPSVSVKETVDGNIRTYLEMADGTWMCEGHTYQFRLEITGRMPNAAVDSTFVYLSNIGNISFEQAYKAAGVSSDQDDYFSPENAILVNMN